MILEKGITGFWHEKRDEPLSLIGENEIRNLIYQVLERRLKDSKGNQMSERLNTFTITRPTYDSNYYRIELQLIREKFVVLINGYHPYFCGIESDSSWMNLQFVELPEMIRLIFAPQFKYLSQDDLLQPVKEHHLNELNKVEIEQIRYWKSQTIGEVIFNGYD